MNSTTATYRIPHFVDGKRTELQSNRTADVLNPSIGEVQAQVVLASAADVDTAVAVAVEAQKDWAAWIKDMDAFNFDLTWAAWGAGPRKDPESMWYSKEADRESGNNYTGFKNVEVDRLIEKQRMIIQNMLSHFSKCFHYPLLILAPA